MDKVEEIEDEVADKVTPDIETNEIDVEVAEEIGDAAVAKAAIESDTQLELARINAELEKLRIKSEEKREKEWQMVCTELDEKVSALTVKLEALQLKMETGQLTPDNLTEAVTEIAQEVSEAEAENNSTPKFMSPPISETKTEATVENEDGEKAKATVKQTRKRRLI